MSDVIGINLGAGRWSRPGWAGYDSLHIPGSGRLDASTRFPVPDASLSFVFSSHFFEHIDDNVAQNLFNESFRVLRPGGALRVSVPDFEATLDHYRAGDDAFFDSPDAWDMTLRYENWAACGVHPNLENKLLYAFTAYENMPDRGLFPAWRYIPGYYCGPPKVDAAEVREAATLYPALVFSAWAAARLPPPAQINETGHINAYTLDKFRVMLFRAGFREVERSEHQRSRFAELRHPAFDNRPNISLFVEAIR